MAKNNTKTSCSIEYCCPNDVRVKDFLKEIRSITKGMCRDEALYAAADFLSKKEGSLEWLLTIKEKCGDKLIISKKFNFNASDMIRIIIRNRIRALEKAAFDVNLEDVLQELESVAWCCSLS